MRHALLCPTPSFMELKAHVCLARAQMSFGRLTQMLEMNFEVMQHFLGSLVSLVERVRAMYTDAF